VGASREGDKGGDSLGASLGVNTNMGKSCHWKGGRPGDFLTNRCRK